jgi:hypothetical protein
MWSGCCDPGSLYRGGKKHHGAALAAMLGLQLALLNPTAFSQSAVTAGSPLVLPDANNIAANWQNAGLLNVGGIPTRTKQCRATVHPSGIIPPAAGDDASLINAAISGCAVGDYVQLAAGATSSITASISGTTLTVTAGSGEAVGNVLRGAGILLGTTITAGSGNSWTVSMSQSVASEPMTAVVPFNIAQSEYIALNKRVTLRGSDNCTGAIAAPFCGTIINVYNGAIADWSISATTNGAHCGVTSASVGFCNAAQGVILMSPSSTYAWGWGGCALRQPSAPTGCGTTLAVDAAQGATTIQVTSVKNFSVGMWVLMDENPSLITTTNPILGNASIQASSDLLSPFASAATNRIANPDSSGGTTYAWSLYPNRVNAELHRITAIGAGPCPGTRCTLTFDDPLTIAFRQSDGHAAQVYWPTQNNAAANPFLTYAGVENLSITRAAAGGIQVMFCAYCWVKNVEVGGWVGGAVNVDWSARTDVEFNYLHNCYDCENNGAEYLISVGAAATESYFANNIVLLGGKGMVGRATGGGNVVAYNYFDMSFYQQASIGNYWMEMSANGSHYAGSHHFLFEGNSTSNCDGDETHGNAIYHTFFRNDCTGIRSTFVDPSNTSLSVNDAAGIGYATGGSKETSRPLRAGGPMAFNYFYAFVGNVMGLAGVTTKAHNWVYQCNRGGSNNNNKCIWMSGWTSGEWKGAGDPNLEAGGAYIFRNGNYDYVNASIVDWASGYSRSLPNSLYASSKPDFFNAGTCTYLWPWVTPTSAPYVQTNSCGGAGLPALARWNAGTPFAQP